MSTSLRLWKLISRHREQRDEIIINLKIRGKLPTDVDPCVPSLDIKIRQKPSVGLKYIIINHTAVVLLSNDCTAKEPILCMKVLKGPIFRIVTF